VQDEGFRRFVAGAFWQWAKKFLFPADILPEIL